jgi:hypothetical protein
VPRQIKTVDCAEWSAEDIDRFADRLTDMSKTVDVMTGLTDIEVFDETLRKFFLEKPPKGCGYWRIVDTALLARENMIEVFYILRRVRLVPLDGKVNVIYWSKDNAT